MIDTNIIESRDSFKRTAEIAELNEGEKGERKLKKNKT